MVVVFGDLLEMEAVVPPTLLSSNREYLLFFLGDDVHLVAGLAATDLGEGVVVVLTGVVVVSHQHLW